MRFSSRATDKTSVGKYQDSLPHIPTGGVCFDLDRHHEVSVLSVFGRGLPSFDYQHGALRSFFPSRNFQNLGGRSRDSDVRWALCRVYLGMYGMVSCSQTSRRSSSTTGFIAWRRAGVLQSTQVSCCHDVRLTYCIRRGTKHRKSHRGLQFPAKEFADEASIATQCPLARGRCVNFPVKLLVA